MLSSLPAFFTKAFQFRSQGLLLANQSLSLSLQPVHDLHANKLKQQRIPHPSPLRENKNLTSTARYARVNPYLGIVWTQKALQRARDEAKEEFSLKMLGSYPKHTSF
ncbi:uncharacterized protein LOC133878023 isoform X2 [Alnus glutinosa]|uniref:uncharacterized protein LOC133878023 isoform X2 n=1 Tax=Alnus glutinosa TaxID=3517 RepID=UPI002D779F36|nr:uncharacterized protein LOC133878023 isoform X2 [Alnus glutinosa]